MLDKAKRKNQLEEHLVKEGLKWEQIACNFCQDAKELFKKFKLGFSITGERIRKVVGKPDSSSFRKYCNENGVRITKLTKKDLYRIQPIDKVKEALDDAKDTRML